MPPISYESPFGTLVATSRGLYDLVQYQESTFEVAIEEGTIRVIHSAEAPSDATYMAVHVKKGGQWKLDTLRETDVPEHMPPASPLGELAWLVSQWTDASAEAESATAVTWIDGNTFTWKSIGRKLGDEFLPNIDEVKMVRKAAGGAVKDTSKPSPKPRKAGVKK